MLTNTYQNVWPISIVHLPPQTQHPKMKAMTLLFGAWTSSWGSLSCDEWVVWSVNDAFVVTDWKADRTVDSIVVELATSHTAKKIKSTAATVKVLRAIFLPRARTTGKFLLHVHLDDCLFNCICRYFYCGILSCGGLWKMNGQSPYLVRQLGQQ